ncbi:hypothetical protein K1T71_005254 [Dendrolimus kikuchii]|uniref:Uncharacterized protein n=1 Tax=Dendrolimus kikuchii TaxID=765133 RepID=A0ACC1D811_9NEOP|nr:hypothetical protein K1T71_005254 [Dendrolimus kikuchii]
MKSSGLVLFICAGLLLSGGAILGGSTAWSLLRMSYYFWTSDLGVELGSSVLFIAGSLLCLPTCWLSTLVPYQPKKISFMATLMMLITVSMLMLSLGLVSFAGLSRSIRDSNALNASMLRAMSHEAYDPAVRNSFGAMQIELKCCGVNSISDWYQYRGSIPPGCCGRISNGKRGGPCEVPRFSNGCLRPALAELRNYINAVSILASSMIMVLAVTLFTAAYSLVIGDVDRKELRSLKTSQPLRIACLTGVHTASPLVSLTSPAAIPNISPPM